jgi:phosphate acyltransferase
MNPVGLAIDVTGGDFGASVVIQGVLEARSRLAGSVKVCLCGDGNTILKALDKHRVRRLPAGGSLSLEHCAQSVENDETPSRVWKNKPLSAIVRCVALQKEGRVQASVSAGNTGVLMAAAIFVLGRQPGISRPALAAFLPTTAGRPVLLLDVGANLNCRPEHLVCFAHLGRGYMHRYYRVTSPKVAVLNIGKERTKGTQTIFETDRALSGSCPGYRGFIEGSRVLAGDVDVIVCDGFVGNVLLKACESFYALTESVLGSSKALLQSIRKSMTIFNSESYGAVPFLGINGIVLKAHGSSSPAAIANAVCVAVTAVQRRTIPRDVPAEPKGRVHT